MVRDRMSNRLTRELSTFFPMRPHIEYGSDSERVHAVTNVLHGTMRDPNLAVIRWSLRCNLKLLRVTEYFEKPVLAVAATAAFAFGVNECLDNDTGGVALAAVGGAALLLRYLSVRKEANDLRAEIDRGVAEAHDQMVMLCLRK
jgi:hypothetical protein